MNDFESIYQYCKLNEMAASSPWMGDDTSDDLYIGEFEEAVNEIRIIMDSGAFNYQEVISLLKQFQKEGDESETVRFARYLCNKYHRNELWQSAKNKDIFNDLVIIVESVFKTK